MKLFSRRWLPHARWITRLQALPLRHHGILGITSGLEAGFKDCPPLRRGTGENQRASCDRGQAPLATGDPIRAVPAPVRTLAIFS